MMFDVNMLRCTNMEPGRWRHYTRWVSIAFLDFYMAAQEHHRVKMCMTCKYGMLQWVLVEERIRVKRQRCIFDKFIEH